MQFAIIDLGTNTFNLMVAELTSDGNYKILLQDKYAAKLGKGGINNKTIVPEAFERGLKGIKTHLNTLKNYNTDNIFCFATSAIRSSANGQDFVKAVKDKFKLDINVISGDKEAELIFDGVKQVVPIGDDKVLIMDVGGGSTEFIIADKRGVIWKHSFNIGAARMVDLIKPSEPLKQLEAEQLYKYAEEKLSLLFEELKKHKIKTLIGSSGAFNTLASIIAAQAHPHLDMSKINSYEIDYKLYLHLHKQLVKSTSNDRLKIKKMEAHRVDSIVLTSLFINFVIEKCKFDKIFQCTYALKEGAIFQLLNKTK